MFESTVHNNEMTNSSPYFPLRTSRLEVSQLYDVSPLESALGFGVGVLQTKPTRSLVSCEESLCREHFHNSHFLSPAACFSEEKKLVLETGAEGCQLVDLTCCQPKLRSSLPPAKHCRCPLLLLRSAVYCPLKTQLGSHQFRDS